MLWISLIILIIIYLQDYSHCLRLLEVHVPRYVVKNETAKLECLYDLEGEILYSIKWYKDGNEFYRYTPMSTPQVNTFELKGVHVDQYSSFEANITLRNVEFETTGRYRCEISGEAPAFTTVTDHGDMTVTVLPEHGNPRIFGARSRYQVNDYVVANCTAGFSKPAVELSWFVNNEQADKSALVHYPPVTVFKRNMGELESNTLGIQFRVERKHFQNNDLRLKCIASLSTFYWRSNEEVIEIDYPQRTHIVDMTSAIHTPDARGEATGHHSMSLGEAFATKLLLLLGQDNAVNGCHATGNWKARILLTSLLTLLLHAIAARSIFSTTHNVAGDTKR